MNLAGCLLWLWMNLSGYLLWIWRNLAGCLLWSISFPSHRPLTEASSMTPTSSNSKMAKLELDYNLWCIHSTNEAWLPGYWHQRTREQQSKDSLKGQEQDAFSFTSRPFVYLRVSVFVHIIFTLKQVIYGLEWLNVQFPNDSRFKTNSPIKCV